MISAGMPEPVQQPAPGHSQGSGSRTAEARVSCLPDHRAHLLGNGDTSYKMCCEALPIHLIADRQLRMLHQMNDLHPFSLRVAHHLPVRSSQPSKFF